MTFPCVGPCPGLPSSTDDGRDAVHGFDLFHHHLASK